MKKEEALKKLRQMTLPKETMEILAVLIPELKESEDERIRRTLVEYFGPGVQLDFVRGVPIQKIRYWLKKQKVNTEGDFGRGYDCGYEACLHSHGAEWFEKQKEPHYTKRNALFDKCVENCDPEVMKEVSDNIDKMLEPKIAVGDLGDKEEPQNKSEAQEKALGGDLTFPQDKDKNLDEIAQDYVDRVKEYNPEPTWNLMQTAVCYGYHYCEQKEQKEIPLMNGDADLYFDNWIQHNDTTKRGCFEEGMRYAKKLQKEQKSYVNTDYFKSFMLQYLQDATNKKDDSEIEATTNYWMEKLLGLIECQKEQKPADDKAFEEWIDGWWKEHKEKAYPQITMDEKEFKNFCRGIKNMYAEQKLAPISCGHENGSPAECKATINGEPIPTENQSVNIPLAGWSDEDEKMFQESLTDIIYAKNELSKKGCEGLAKSALDAFNWLNTRFKFLRPKKLDASKLENFDPVDVLNRIKKGWPMAWEKVVGKQEWNDEDELTVADLINYFEGDSLECSAEEMVQRIKSLRPSWKPSEEQMEALNYAIAEWDGGKKLEGLYALRNDLKKL